MTWKAIELEENNAEKLAQLIEEAEAIVITLLRQMRIMPSILLVTIWIRSSIFKGSTGLCSAVNIAMRRHIKMKL